MPLRLLLGFTEPVGKGRRRDHSSIGVGVELLRHSLVVLGKLLLLLRCEVVWKKISCRAAGRLVHLPGKHQWLLSMKYLCHGH